MSTNPEQKTSLFIKRNLAPIYSLSLIIAVLMAATALIGLLYRETTYPTHALVDVIVIFIMGLVCFVSFGLFVRGVEKSHGAHLL